MRPDLSQPLADGISSALAVDPAKRPPAERLAAALRAALEAPRAPRARTPKRTAPKAAAVTKPVPLERRLVPAALAAVTVTFGAALLPFWPPGLVLLIALAAAVAALRAPRLGLAIALFVPVFPLGNVAQAAAVAYSLLALGWLAVCWRDARAGLLFVAGPLLASIGALALLPLAVQPARGRWRRALHACTGVIVAAAVAGLRGAPLPLTGAVVPNLGLEGSTRVADVVQALSTVVADNVGLVLLGVVLGLVAAVLPDARRRGLRGIAILGVTQIALVAVLAPALPLLPVMLGTLALCGVLATVSVRSARYP